MITRYRRWIQRRRDTDDAGFTLLELTASMTIMSVFMVMFVGAITQMFNASEKTDAVTQVTSQLNLAFERLDKQVRYASAISPPNQTLSPAGAWYVEFDNTSSGSDNCYQLRLQAGVLSERTWNGTPSTVPTWVPLSSGMTMPTTSPFTFYTASGSQTSQRLKLNLQSTVGGHGGAATGQSSVSFQAMNSGQVSSPTNDGSSLICQNTGDGGRP